MEQKLKDKEKISCDTCNKNKVCRFFYDADREDVGNKIDCNFYRHKNFDSYTRDDFKKILKDKIMESDVTAKELLIVYHIFDLLKRLRERTD